MAAVSWQQGAGSAGRSPNGDARRSSVCMKGRKAAVQQLGRAAHAADG